MVELARRILKPLASLRLTVVLLALGIILVFTGTLAQMHQGIWAVQKQYFHSLVARAHLGHVPILIPGGLAIGGVMLVNLLAAHAVRFKLSWKRAGIIMIHSGVILLLVGELVTSVFAVEMQMPIPQGQTIGYAQDIREPELAVIDTSTADPKRDRVTAFPRGVLREGSVLRHELLPLEIKVDRYLINGELVGPMQKVPGVLKLADHGDGAKIGLVELPDETDPDRSNMAGAFVTITGRGQRLGTWMLSTRLDPQAVEFEGKTFLIALRPRRYYQPFTVGLIKFTHKNYPGTQIPSEFSSRVRLIDPRPERNEDREALIYMNAPLRYDGKTFYQASFLANDTTTILEVVKNPGTWLPYVSCTLVGVGMLIHFLMTLGRFLKKGAA